MLVPLGCDSLVTASYVSSHPPRSGASSPAASSLHSIFFCSKCFSISCLFVRVCVFAYVFFVCMCVRVLAMRVVASLSVLEVLAFLAGEWVLLFAFFLDDDVCHLGPSPLLLSEVVNMLVKKALAGQGLDAPDQDGQPSGQCHASNNWLL